VDIGISARNISGEITMLNRKSGFALVMLVMVLAIAAVSYSQVQADPAFVLHAEDGCTIDNLDREIIPLEGNARGDGTLVITQSANGNWSIACTGRLPEGSRLPDKAVVWTVEDVGGGCGMPGWIYTTDFQELITPSGQAHIICYYPESPMPQGQVASFGRMP
jgi:hypothetical protein